MQKLRAACFRVSKTSNQISSLVPWLNMSNSNNDKYLNMTVAEIKKAFRQKGVTRRLISDVDMDDFLLSFSDQFYNSSTINRKDIPNTNVNVSNLAKFLQQTKSAATQGQHNLGGETLYNLRTFIGRGHSIPFFLIFGALDFSKRTQYIGNFNNILKFAISKIDY